ncbi:MAG: glycosyl hydrolase [Gaiellales bacterium]
MPARPRIPLRAALLALTALALLAAPAVAGAKATLKVGFLDNVYVTGQAASFWADVDQLNVGMMRWDVQWKYVAPRKPQRPRDPADPAYQWGETDSFVRNAKAHGLQDRVLFTLWRTPPWASSLKSKKGIETHMPKTRYWRDFVYAAAKRYSGRYTPPGATEPLPRVLFWETWNEPNANFAFRPQYVKGKAVSPRNYVKLLHTLRSQVKPQIPRAKFVAGAFYKQGGPRSVTPINFMRGMKAARARFDILSVHPYNNTPRLGLKDGREESRTNPKFIGVGNFQTFISLSNQIFGRKYPIWVTEFGWATPAPGKSQYTVSFKQQARFLYESVRRFKQLPQVDVMIWFLIEDNPPRPAGAWYTTGLRTSDGTAKPSWSSWIAAASTLRKQH